MTGWSSWVPGCLDVKEIEVQFAIEPYKHQLDEFIKTRDLPYWAHFWDMGTGKSKLMIDLMAYLYLQGQIDVVVIFAKKGEYRNWKLEEIPKHMSPDVEYVCEVYHSGLRSAEKEAIRQLARPQPRLRVICINVESMNWDSKAKKMITEGGKVASGIVKSAVKGVLCITDESTCVKSHKSGRSMAVKQISRNSAYRRILTGTPSTRSPVDLWGQALVLGDGLLGFRTLTEFKRTYEITEKAFYGNRSFDRVTGYHNLDRLNKQLSTFSSILLRSDCVDLPDKIYKKVVVPLTDKQESLYTEMRDLAMLQLGDGEIVDADSALAVISRLDQIVCGQVKREDGTYEVIESNRPDYLLAQLESSSSKGIIWCNFRGVLHQLYDRLTREFDEGVVGRFYGGVDDAERQRTIWEFKNGSKLRWIVANQASMGYGHTLVEGKENHYFSNGYSLEQRLQSEDRTMRIGQEDKVLYNDYVTPGTVNDRKLAILRDRKEMSSLIMGSKITDWI